MVQRSAGLTALEKQQYMGAVEHGNGKSVVL